VVEQPRLAVPVARVHVTAPVPATCDVCRPVAAHDGVSVPLRMRNKHRKSENDISPACFGENNLIFQWAQSFPLTIQVPRPGSRCGSCRHCTEEESVARSKNLVLSLPPEVERLSYIL
jgi:hypothetical protein